MTRKVRSALSAHFAQGSTQAIIGKAQVWALAAVFVGLMLPGKLSADVSFQRGNGNVYFAFKDVLQPELERVYNSKSGYKGMFGWGWGSSYDTYIKVSADGSVVVHEFGAGAENRFNPVAFNAKELDDAVSNLASVAQKAGVAGTTDQLEAYKKRLKHDATFRNDEWNKFLAQGKNKPRTLAKGTQLQSNRFSYQFITKTETGYVRKSDTGKTEEFNEAGKLVKVTDKNNNYIDVTYSKDGHIEKLMDKTPRKLFLTFNNKGLLTKVATDSGKSATYQYNDKDELIASSDIDGNKYEFKYDAQNRHNLIEIKYADKTTAAIAYYGRDKHENVKSVKDRDGTLTEYDFEYDSKDKGRSKVMVHVKDSKGETVAKNSYEYFAKTKATGEEWTYKLVANNDGESTETTYNECCGQPLLIKKGGEETAFEYDVKGHLTKKTTPSDVTELSYDMAAGKVAKVVRYSKSNPKQTTWSDFKYDEKANLIFAKNSEGKGVKLVYDNAGRISSLVDQAKHQIRFKYNEESKPIEITDPSIGSINVAYTNSGEIKKVDSTAGRKIATEVTNTFQNLLEILRPAGVTFSFTN